MMNRISNLRIPRCDALPRFAPRSCQDENILLYFFTEYKIYHLSCSIYKRDAIDIADPSSMQDASYI